MAKVGRNEPCPCGSGKKSKKCCGTSFPVSGTNTPSFNSWYEIEQVFYPKIVQFEKTVKEKLVGAADRYLIPYQDLHEHHLQRHPNFYGFAVQNQSTVTDRFMAASWLRMVYLPSDPMVIELIDLPENFQGQHYMEDASGNRTYCSDASKVVIVSYKWLVGNVPEYKNEIDLAIPQELRDACQNILLWGHLPLDNFSISLSGSVVSSGMAPNFALKESIVWQGAFLVDGDWHSQLVFNGKGQIEALAALQYLWQDKEYNQVVVRTQTQLDDAISSAGNIDSAKLGAGKKAGNRVIKINQFNNKIVVSQSSPKKDAEQGDDKEKRDSSNLHWKEHDKCYLQCNHPHPDEKKAGKGIKCGHVVEKKQKFIPGVIVNQENYTCRKCARLVSNFSFQQDSGQVCCPCCGSGFVHEQLIHNLMYGKNVICVNCSERIKKPVFLTFFQKKIAHYPQKKKADGSGSTYVVANGNEPAS